MADQQGLQAFQDEARAWLDGHAERREGGSGDEDLQWGAGDDSVAVFHNLTLEEERRLHDDASAWQRTKFDAGFGAISWEERYGGRGLPSSYERWFRSEEGRYRTPVTHELFSVTTGLIAPTVAVYGTEEQKDRFVRAFLRTDEYCSQLFSEPGAGSDLAALGCKAERDGDEWVLNGQKVWNSGTVFAQWGEIICRSDPAAPKHKGQTAFLVPLDAPGVEIRPIRQMTGGASFNEVFLTDVRIPDTLRLGGVGEGWKVALTTLGFERGASSGGGRGVGGSFRRVLAMAGHLEHSGDPVARQMLTRLFTRNRLLQLNGQRAQAASRAGQAPGPEGSIGKLLWTENMTRTSDVVSHLLGARLAADTGEWGTYAWGEHVLGAPGYRIAGGSDEVQRNIIGERVLGLPREPQADKDVPWSEAVRGTRA